ncbi:TetR/AcrR family transcriptional regulator [Nocardia cyriacigeorgica]|uniref:TetR/AcrR family transcriptional regulator n=1 Tax=Nocardia cyriacigeorgica TaxID=135487 RepID=A0A5R8P725_9NOCA|nr:TetR/AcrR family transcriptional regulator [Nocardia cyriacigeorgica]TLF97564.1 TetR/AcrR family transcriptional regulator [Nocardia cyriacigeorgica]
MSAAGTKGVPRAEREAQILDVAAAEIGRVGYAGLSLGAVAAQAGVSKPLVYGYFGSKDGLYVACVRRAGAVLGDAIDLAISGTPTLEMAERTLTAIFAALEPRPYDWKVVFDRSHPADGPAAEAAQAARGRIAAQAEQGVAAFLANRGLTDAGDRSALTAVWTGLVEALVDWWLQHPEQTAQQMSARSRRLFSVLA